LAHSKLSSVIWLKISLTTTGSETGTQQDAQEIIDVVRQRFSVSREYLREDGVVEFSLDLNQANIKSSFLALLQQLRKKNNSAVLRRADNGYLLMVFEKPVYHVQRLKTPLFLFLATVAAVIADGFLRAYGYSAPHSPHLSLSNDLTFALIYAVALMGILGIHELGHKIASWHHGMNSSWPYFIPGIPSVWPTFGAVIRAADPPPNRDSLFDLGLSGPIAGLMVTVIVSIVAVASAQLAPASEFASSQLSTGDYYTNFLGSLLKPSSSGQVITGPMFTLLYFAYSIGFLITFINLLPAWQLDGGHIANSAVSPRVHRWLTYISAGVLIVSGFFLMGLLVLFLSSRAPSLRPLDDVSPLSSKRKIFFALTWVLAICIGVFAIYNGVFWIGNIFT
jgi:membrane-associated protease RseP (regulator of RpoE activity)